MLYDPTPLSAGDHSFQQWSIFSVCTRIHGKAQRDTQLSHKAPAMSIDNGVSHIWSIHIYPAITHQIHLFMYVYIYIVSLPSIIAVEPDLRMVLTLLIKSSVILPVSAEEVQQRR